MNKLPHEDKHCYYSWYLLTAKLLQEVSHLSKIKENVSNPEYK